MCTVRHSIHIQQQPERCALRAHCSRPKSSLLYSKGNSTATPTCTARQAMVPMTSSASTPGTCRARHACATRVACSQHGQASKGPVDMGNRRGLSAQCIARAPQSDHGAVALPGTQGQPGAHPPTRPPTPPLTEMTGTPMALSRCCRRGTASFTASGQAWRWPLYPSYISCLHILSTH